MVRPDRGAGAGQGIEVEVAKFPWGASGRAITVDRPDGLTKLMLEPKTGRGCSASASPAPAPVS